jgi:molecular chaperone DnaK
MPQIEVTFDIDANGIVHVSAKDLGTGKEQKIRIESSSGLSDDEIDRMVKDAELHADEDKKTRERAEAHNEADTLVYTTDKSLAEYGDKLAAEDRANIDSALAAVKQLLEAKEPAAIDVDELKRKTEALRQASYKLAEEVYKNSSEAAAGGQTAGGPAADGTDAGNGTGQAAGGDGASAANGHARGAAAGKVEDVDYEVVDDDEKK